TIYIKDKQYDNILIEPYSRVMKSEYGAQQESNYLLMIDKANTPDYEELKELLVQGESIKYDDTFHTILSREPIYDRLHGIEHHLEVVLL
ncbi:MAG: hypothetical protein ACK5LC_14415, partial [Coprobacillaceae bacterium]